MQSTHRKNILIIGVPGSGKTWIMQSLISKLNDPSVKKLGLLWFVQGTKLSLTGRYDGSMFQGSDKLSMAVMTHVPEYKKYAEENDLLTFWEGDRFTNSKFIELMDPLIIRIASNGEAGRTKRGSSQTERHLKAMTTRVDNIKPHITLQTSLDVKDYICNNLL